MTATVIWLVVWLIVTGAAIPLFTTLGVFLAVTVARDEEFAPAGLLGGWLLGLITAGWGLVQVILHIIHLVQALT